jgi:hypothetical protein
MERLTSEQIQSMMEALNQVYDQPEALNEEVETEEVNMELEEDSEVLDEQGRNKTSPEQVAANRRALANTLLYGNPKGRSNRVTTPRQRRGSGARNRSSSSSSSRPTELAAGAAAEKSRPGAGLPVSGGNQGSNRPAPRPAPRPSSAPASKPAAAAPAKPVVKQTGDKSKDMAAWAKANPKLAAAKAERDRTRGASASTNPLMRGMPGKRPAPTSLNKTGAGAKFDPKAPKILNQDVDLFDIIINHLLDEGYADIEESAIAIMANMSEEWRQSILLELTPLGIKTKGVVDDQRRGSNMAKDMMATDKILKKLNRPKGPVVMPTLPGV